MMYVVNRRARGLSDATQAAGITQQVGGLATPVAAPVIAGALPAILPSTLAVPIIGAALAGVTLLVTSLIKNSGCGITCVETSQWANQAENLLQQNSTAYQSEPTPRTQSSQAQAEANFNNIWNQLVASCSQPGTGNAGVRCIKDRQRGGKFDWWAYYLDPIANDPNVAPDAQAAMPTSTGISTSGIPTWAWLAAAAVAVWAVAS